MKSIRYVAACLLILTGLIHVASPGLVELDKSALTIMVFFGIAYLIIGGFLFSRRKRTYYFGAIVPVIGLIVATLGLLSNPAMLTPMMVLLMAIDVVVVLSCVYLISGQRRRQAPESL